MTALHRKVIERARILAEDTSTDLTNRRHRRKKGETVKVGFPRRRAILAIERARRIEGRLSPGGHS